MLAILASLASQRRNELYLKLEPVIKANLQFNKLLPTVWPIFGMLAILASPASQQRNALYQNPGTGLRANLRFNKLLQTIQPIFGIIAILASQQRNALYWNLGTGLWVNLRFNKLLQTVGPILGMLAKLKSRDRNQSESWIQLCFCERFDWFAKDYKSMKEQARMTDSHSSIQQRVINYILYHSLAVNKHRKWFMVFFFWILYV